MRGIITAAACLVLIGGTWAQQDPHFTQYMFDRLSINPAVAGTSGNICATALLRQQWTGFDGAPKTGLLNVHGPLQKISSGIGLTAYMDQLGQEKTAVGRLHYSYHRRVNGGVGTLAIGVYVGLTSRSLGSKWLSVDPVSDDDAIPDNGSGDAGFDAGAGIYYVSKKFYAGISSTQLPEAELKQVSIKNVRHYYVLMGYDWALGGNDKYVLQPSALVKSDGASTQFDLTANFLYNNMLWLGVSFRTEDAIAPMIGYKHESADGKSSIKVGYSYDVTTSELKNYSSGSHEIMLSYCFKIEKAPTREIYRNIRYL